MTVTSVVTLLITTGAVAVPGVLSAPPETAEAGVVTRLVDEKVTVTALLLPDTLDLTSDSVARVGVSVTEPLPPAMPAT